MKLTDQKILDALAHGCSVATPGMKKGVGGGVPGDAVFLRENHGQYILAMHSIGNPNYISLELAFIDLLSDEWEILDK